MLLGAPDSPCPKSGMGRSLRLIFTEKIKAGLRRVLCAICLFLAGILAEAVLSPQAPVDIIYTLI